MKIPLTGGVNLLADPANIRDDQCCWAKNLVPVKPGRVGKRPGVRWDFATTDTVAGAYPSAFLPSPASDYDFVAVISDQAGGDTVKASLYVIRQGVASTTQVLGGNPLAPWLMAFAKSVYCFSGVGAMYVVNLDGTISVFSFAGAGNGNIQPKVAAQYRRRAVYAQGSTLIWSDNDAPGTVGDNALSVRGLTVGDRDGDTIVALREVMLTAVGSPAQSALLVLKQRVAYLVTGEPTQTTDSTSPIWGDVTVSRFNVNCGCASPWTLANTPYGLFWASADDVWFYEAGGQVPRRVGTSIQPALKQTPQSQKYKWHAAYYDGFYRLAIFREGQRTESFWSCEDQWWLDLRGLGAADAAPDNADAAQWWGPQEVFQVAGGPAYGTYNMCLDTRPGGDGSLLSLNYKDPRLYLGSFAGGNAADVSQTSTTDVEGPVEAELLTKQYQPEDDGLDFIYEGLELGAYVSENTRLSVEVSSNGGESVDTNTATFEAKGLRTGITRLGDSTAMKYVQQKLCPPSNPLARPVGNTMQLRIYDTAGYEVIRDMDFQFTRGGTLYTATLPSGTYANLPAFAVAIQSAMNSAVDANGQVAPGVGFTVTVNANNTITIEDIGGGQGWVNIQSTDAAAAKDDNQWVWATLGFKTYGAIQDGENTTVTSVESVPTTRAAHFELYGCSLNATLIPRRPAP